MKKHFLTVGLLATSLTFFFNYSSQAVSLISNLKIQQRATIEDSLNSYKVAAVLGSSNLYGQIGRGAPTSMNPSSITLTNSNSWRFINSTGNQSTTIVLRKVITSGTVSALQMNIVNYSDRFFSAQDKGSTYQVLAPNGSSNPTVIGTITVQ